MAEDMQNSKKEWQAPAWTKGLVVKPDQAWTKGQIRLWGLGTLLGLVLPPFISYANRFSWLVCIAQLTFRGMPKTDVGGGGMGMDFGSGPGSKSHIKVAWLIGIVITVVGLLLTYGLMPAWAKGQRGTPIIAYAMRNFIYTCACCYFQPYKKNRS